MKIKKFLSSITALMLIMSSSVSTSTIAFSETMMSNVSIVTSIEGFNQEKADKTLETAISLIDEDRVIFTPKQPKLTAVMTKDDTYFLYPMYDKQRIVTLKSDDLLDEINEKIAPDYYLKPYLDRYEISPTYKNLTDMTIEEAVEIVMQYTDFITFSEGYFVERDTREYNITGIEITSELTAQEIIDRYPELTLVESEEASEDYTYKFDFNDFIVSGLNYTTEYAELNEEHSKDETDEFLLKLFKNLDFCFYDVIKELSMDADISDWRLTLAFDAAQGESGTMFYSDQFVLNISEIVGDTNADGDINISDVLAVSAHINNKDKYPMDEQSIINGDVHDTGNGLNSSDAFMIQQYITGVIEAL